MSVEDGFISVKDGFISVEDGFISVEDRPAPARGRDTGEAPGDTDGAQEAFRGSVAGGEGPAAVDGAGEGAETDRGDSLMTDTRAPAASRLFRKTQGRGSAPRRYFSPVGASAERPAA